MSEFKFLNNGYRVNLVVEVEALSEDADKIGFTRDSILNDVKTRLCSVRAYDSYEVGKLRPILYVRVLLLGEAYGIEVWYQKLMLDPESGQPGYATTWQAGGIGDEGGADVIREQVCQYIERFLGEYLLVNKTGKH